MSTVPPSRQRFFCTGGWTRTSNRINQVAYEATAITTSAHTGICTLGRTRTDTPLDTVSKTAVYTIPPRGQFIEPMTRVELVSHRYQRCVIAVIRHWLIVVPAGIEPTTSSMSRKRSPTELRDYLSVVGYSPTIVVVNYSHYPLQYFAWCCFSLSAFTHLEPMEGLEPPLDLRLRFTKPVLSPLSHIGINGGKF